MKRNYIHKTFLAGFLVVSSVLGLPSNHFTSFNANALPQSKTTMVDATIYAQVEASDSKQIGASINALGMTPYGIVFTVYSDSFTNSPSPARFIVNGKDVSTYLYSADSRLFAGSYSMLYKLEGDPRQLNLLVGENKIVVEYQNYKTAPWILSLTQRQIRDSFDAYKVRKRMGF